jgi:hypothetical protein
MEEPQTGDFASEEIILRVEVAALSQSTLE